MRAPKFYDFTLAANGSQTLLVEGDYFKVYSCTGQVSISIDGGGIIGPLNAGQGLRDQPFRRITVTDKSGSANVGTIVVAESNFVDDRITGEVSVIDGGLVRTNALAAWGVSGELAASVGNLGHIQLWNPGTNTRALALNFILMSSNTASPNFYVKHSNAALTTLYNTAGSKKVGANTSVVEVRTQANATLLGINNQYNSLYGSAIPLKLDFKEPLVIPINSGLIVANNVANAHLSCTFDYFDFAP